MKHYFIVYEVIRGGSLLGGSPFQTIEKVHPLLWQMECNDKYEEFYKVLFFKEIPEDVALNVKGYL